MKMSSEEKLKQRAIIQYCVGLGHTPVQTMEMLNRSTTNVTMHELCSVLNMGNGTVHRILRDELNISRVCARWVRRLLKNHEMERRVMDSKTFLRRF